MLWMLRIAAHVWICTFFKVYLLYKNLVNNMESLKNVDVLIFWIKMMWLLDIKEYKHC